MRHRVLVAVLVIADVLGLTFVGWHLYNAVVGGLRSGRAVPYALSWFLVTVICLVSVVSALAVVRFLRRAKQREQRTESGKSTESMGDNGACRRVGDKS